MENPFVCDKCNKKYFRIYTIEKHREKCKSKTNTITMEELYQCIIELKEKNKLLEERLEKVESNKQQIDKQYIDIKEWIEESFADVSLEEFTEKEIDDIIIDTILEHWSKSNEIPLKCFHERKRNTYMFQDNEWKQVNKEEIQYMMDISLNELRKTLMKWYKERKMDEYFKDMYVLMTKKIMGKTKLTNKKVLDIQKNIYEKIK